MFLGRIVDIGAELYAMSAACVRAQMIRDDDPEQGALAAELADAFCTQARIRADVLFHGLWRNADATNRRLAKHVIERRHLAEAGVLLLDDDAPWIPNAYPDHQLQRICTAAFLEQNTALQESQATPVKALRMIHPRSLPHHRGTQRLERGKHPVHDAGPVGDRGRHGVGAQEPVLTGAIRGQPISGTASDCPGR